MSAKTKAYSQAQIDAWKAELRAVDAEVVYWEARARLPNAESRRRANAALKVWKAKQKSLTGKVHRVIGKADGV